MIGREIIRDEEASANYRLHEVRQRRTGEVSWAVVDVGGTGAVAIGIGSRAEALRVVRSLERLSQRQEGGLPDHVLVH